VIRFAGKYMAFIVLAIAALGLFAAGIAQLN
jgi:hypothetical protein